MADLFINDSDPHGATQSADRLVVDAGLSDWVYHRNKNDQSLRLGEISKSLSAVDDFKLPANLHRLKDRFIYDLNTGFCAAVVQDDAGYVVVFRGTDLGSAGLDDVASATIVCLDFQRAWGLARSTPPTTSTAH